MGLGSEVGDGDGYCSPRPHPSPFASLRVSRLMMVADEKIIAERQILDDSGGLVVRVWRKAKERLNTWIAPCVLFLSERPKI